MTGFQPHAGSPVNLRGEVVEAIRVEQVVRALGAHVQSVDPYKIVEVKEALHKALTEPGVSVVVASSPCYLQSQRQDAVWFEQRLVQVDQDACTSCMVCINDFGCPALQLQDGVVAVDDVTCVRCGVCVDVCPAGAIG